MRELRLERGSVYGYDRECELEHCGDKVPDEVGIHLCAKHLRKAWAAYQLIQGGEVDTFRAPRAEPEGFWDEKGYVYFAAVGNLIKIGFSKNPDRRKGELGASHIFRYEPGTRREESAYHERFKADLHHGKEWFNASSALIDYIKSGERQVAA